MSAVQSPSRPLWPNWPRWLRGTPLRVVSVASFVLLWFLVTKAGLVNPLFLPAPDAVIEAAEQLFRTGELQKNISTSLVRIAQGFVFGGIVGIIGGLSLGQSRAARQALRPILELLRPIPSLAWAPLVLIWFGIGEIGKIILIAHSVFFPVFTNTIDGIRGIPGNVVHAARTLGAPNHQIFLRVLLPSTLPNILTGLTIGMGQAFSVLVAAELIAATEGMGWMISDARSFFRTDVVILGMVLIGTLGFVFVKIIVLVRRRLLRWYTPEARRAR